MDPAQPGFDFAGASARLDKGDASFVDVIHTNSGTLFEVQNNEPKGSAVLSLEQRCNS